MMRGAPNEQERVRGNEKKEDINFFPSRASFKRRDCCDGARRPRGGGCERGWDGGGGGDGEKEAEGGGGGEVTDSSFKAVESAKPH